MGSTRSTPRAETGWLCAGFGIALLLRLYGITFQSLWLDELLSWRYASHPSVSGSLGAIATDVHPPGYYLVLHFALRLFGDSPFVMRLPSAVFGALCVPAIYLLGRRLWGWREGLLAGVLVSVAWEPVYYSQEARMYSALLLVTIVSSVAAVRLYQEPRDRRAFVYYALAAAAALYVHYYGLLVVGLQAIVLGLITRRSGPRWKQLAACYGLVGLCFLPWAGETLVDFGRTVPHIRTPTSEFVSVFLASPFNQSPVMAGAAACTVVVAALLWLRGHGATGESRLRAALTSPSALCLGAFLVPFAIVFLKSQIGQPIVKQRSLIVCLPGAYLLVARALVVITERRRVPVVATGALLGLGLLGHLVFVKDYYTTITKAEFRGVVERVLDTHPDGSTLVLGTPAGCLSYYFLRADSPVVVRQLRTWEEYEDALPALEEVVVGERFWLISAHREPEERVRQALGERFRQVDVVRLHRAVAVRFERAE